MRADARRVRDAVLASTGKCPEEEGRSWSGPWPLHLSANTSQIRPWQAVARKALPLLWRQACHGGSVTPYRSGRGAEAVPVQPVAGWGKRKGMVEGQKGNQGYIHQQLTPAYPKGRGRIAGASCERLAPGCLELVRRPKRAAECLLEPPPERFLCNQCIHAPALTESSTIAPYGIFRRAWHTDQACVTLIYHLYGRGRSCRGTVACAAEASDDRLRRRPVESTRSSSR